MKKYICFFMMALYVVGALGGIGHTLYIHEYVTAVGIAILAVMAWPTLVKFYKYITE